MKKFRGIMALALCLAMIFPQTANAAAPNQQPTGGEGVTNAIVSTGALGDVSLKFQPDIPKVMGGENAKFDMILTPNAVSINKVYLDVNDEFPFVINDEANKVIVPETGKEMEPLECIYDLVTKETPETVYPTTNLVIEYTKDSKGLVLVRPISATTSATAGTEDPGTAEPTEEPIADGGVTTTGSNNGLSTPRLIITGFETSPATVYAGQEFKLTVHVKNTSKRTAVSNIKYTLSSAENEFLPKSGSNTVYFDKIGKQSETDIVIDMKAKNDLTQKPYVLTLAAAYEDSSCTGYEASDNISIPVYQKAEFSIEEVEVNPQDIGIGEQADVMFTINNKGKGALYNVNVQVKGDTVESDETYVGNIEAGSSGYADIMVIGTNVTEDDGNVTAIVTYEDADGNKDSYEEDIQIFVNEFSTMDEEMMPEEEMMDGEMSTGPSIVLILIIVCVVGIAVLVTVVIVIKKKKAKREKEEDEDEIL